MGATFKEDVSDIRNSKVIDVVKELQSFQVRVDLVDPHASSEEMKHEYGVGLVEIGSGYDAIIVAVNHREYRSLDENYFRSILKDGKGVFVDIKGLFKGKISALEYWSL
jgi:UDP-N-acetyl-D-galactosamine dehydrogenase